MTQKRCEHCGRWFRLDLRTPRQKVCSRAICLRARRRQKMRSWRKRHPGHATKWLVKVQAWAKAYPDYWRRYRGRHQAYVERDNRRRRMSHRRARRAANVTSTAKILVEKLRTVAAREPFGAANATSTDRRVDALVEVLIWKELAANRNRIEARALSAG